MQATVATAGAEFPSLNDVIFVQTVDVVQNVIVTDQLKRALDYIFTAVTDLQRPDRSATPENLESLRSELRSELAELKAEREASAEAAASQQVKELSKLRKYSCSCCLRPTYNVGW